jgi:hypothetical protein
VTGVLVVVFFVFERIVRRVDSTMKRTREMLLLFPEDVVSNVSAVKTLMREYVRGHSVKRA